MKNITSEQPQTQATKWDFPIATQSIFPRPTHLLITTTSLPSIPQLKQSLQTQFKYPVRHKSIFRSNRDRCNKAAHVRYAVSPKQIATHHESSMATSANQLNLVNQVQTPMYSFMLLNIARLFTKSKPKFKLVHDVCSRSTLFLGLCETFLFDGINDLEIQIPDFTVI